jgi:hypothetical protein
MSDDPRDVLLGQFQFLIDRLGFRVVASQAFQSFDNLLLDLQNDVMTVRIVRDRSYINAELSPVFAPDRWVPLGHLRQVALERDPVEEPTLEQEAEFMRSHYETIVTMLSAENFEETGARVLNLGRERLKRLYPGSVRDE